MTSRILYAKCICQNIIRSRWPPASLTVLTDERIKFSAKFGFYLWISGPATKIWRNITVICLLIFLSHDIGNAWHWNRLERKVPKKKWIRPTLQAYGYAKRNYISIKVVFDLQWWWGECVIVKVHNQSYSAQECKKCAGHCCIWPCGWLGGSLWHYSAAKYFTQIWPHLLIAEFYPPNKTSKALRLTIEPFSAANA